MQVRPVTGIPRARYRVVIRFAFWLLRWTFISIGAVAAASVLFAQLYSVNEEFYDPAQFAIGVAGLFSIACGVMLILLTRNSRLRLELRSAKARCEALERSAFSARSTSAVAMLRIRVQADPQAQLAQLGIDKLRFYIDGESPVVHVLYELLLNSVERITLAAPDNAKIAPLELPASCIASVGFSADEALLDYDPRSFVGYQLIQEYFVLPEKFLFFEVSGLDFSRFKNAVDLIFTIKPFGRPERLARLEQSVSAETFRLHCTPIVNLFKQQAEPIQITQERHEYPVIPDVRRPLGLEVYSIDSVRKFSRSREREAIVEFQPFYSVKHGVEGEDAANHYWLSRRGPSALPNDEGTQVSIALVDRSMSPATPAVETLSLSLTCTNRDLPSSLPFGGNDSALQIEEGGAISIARLLKKPTATWRAPMRLANQWRLISHLALNHLSIVDEPYIAKIGADLTKRLAAVEAKATN